MTYEDTYPTVNLEAAACGIPVATYRTDGSIECVEGNMVVPQGDIDKMKELILNRKMELVRQTIN